MFQVLALRQRESGFLSDKGPTLEMLDCTIHIDIHTDLFVSLFCLHNTLFIFLYYILCLTPDDFIRQGRASWWERVKTFCILQLSKVYSLDAI